MKARVFLAPLVLALVFLIAQAAAATLPPEPDQVTWPDVPLTVPETIAGHDAREWHQAYLNEHKHVRKLQRAFRMQLRLGGYGLIRDFLCIHSFEGPWDDPNAPYWGGVQMDLNFQRMYGRNFLSAWGTADHWPPIVQIVVAMNAYLSGRGFYPWPNTARYCGLL